MSFIEPDLENYIENNSSEESEVLKKLNRNTHAHVLSPRMLSGHLQGRVLSMLSHMIKPKYILEIGTYTGYSAICMAEGLQKDGELHTLDINEELEEMVNQYIYEAGFENKIIQHIGNAMDIIPHLKKPWDLVFIDADKRNYLNYYQLLIDVLPQGSYIIADNVLWSGKILQDKEKMDKSTSALDSFNKYIQEDPRVENVLFPIRDGLMVCRKK